MKRDEMPIGFSMALAQNPEAMQKFAMLNENKKQEIIAGTHSVKSKEEMHQYVNKLTSEN
ncbi:MAG: hypothetical protein IJW78_01025 [Clostridia bacterium]|nr:hypothetical protein [Clostridia bacterium]